MSEWINIEKGDISQSEHKDEIHIWFESDDNGNRYISIEKDALKYLKELLAPTN